MGVPYMLSGCSWLFQKILIFPNVWAKNGIFPQKNKGCFAMECSFCKTEFCWNCLAKLNHLSFHFKCTDGRINWSFIPDIVDPLGILLSLNFVLYLSNVHPPTTNILIFKLTKDKNSESTPDTQTPLQWP